VYLLYNLLYSFYNKSTTNRSNGVWALFCGVFWATDRRTDGADQIVRISKLCRRKVVRGNNKPETPKGSWKFALRIDSELRCHYC